MIKHLVTDDAQKLYILQVGQVHFRKVLTIIQIASGGGAGPYGNTGLTGGTQVYIMRWYK